MDDIKSHYNEVVGSIESDYNENKDISKQYLNKTSNYLANILKSSSKDNKKLPYYLNYDWRVYRNVFLTIIFILFFVFKGFETYLTKRGFDQFLIKVYNLISFFTLINITIYFFMVTFNRYRSNIKGKRGQRGSRGKRGLQGSNSNCDICNTKPYTMKKIYKKIPKAEKVKNEDLVINMSNPPDKGWRLIVSNSNDTASTGSCVVITDSDTASTDSGYVNILNNTYIGVECDDCSKLDNNSSDHYIEVNDKDIDKGERYRKHKVINLNKKKKNGSCQTNEKEQRPIIGVAANYDSKINSLQYFVDNNAKHSKRRYIPELLGTRFGESTNSDEKHNFICPNNSAIYKVDSISNSNGIVGLKYYCQDIDTGKEVLVHDKNNYKSYGYTFGREPNEDDKEHYFKSIKCEPLKDKSNNVYPTFISEVSGSSKDDVIKNLKFHKCSYYKPG